MLFCEERFGYFFAIVFALYWSMPWHRARVWLLLGASFYFYASWNKWLPLIIFASSGLDFCLGRWIEALRSPGRKRLLVAVSVVANLGLLCYFKYANFFLDSLAQGLRAAGLDATLPTLSVILPIGIS